MVEGATIERQKGENQTDPRFAHRPGQSFFFKFQNCAKKCQKIATDREFSIFRLFVWKQVSQQEQNLTEKMSVAIFEKKEVTETISYRKFETSKVPKNDSGFS